VLLQLSTLYLQKKDLATAFSLVSRAISQDGGDTDLYLFAAAIRLQEEKPDAAARLLTHYEKLVSPAGGNYFLVLSGVIHNRFKEWPQAVSRFKKVKDWAVQENVFLIEYIYALVRSGQTEIAYRILQQNKQKLSAGEFWLGRAIYYYGLNMPEEAGKNLNEALKVGCNTAFITYFLEMHQTDFPGMITEKKCQQYEYILKPPYAD
jgi:predicted Zn-dependent protease